MNIPPSLLTQVRRCFELSATKILSIESSWKENTGAPVFTIEGKYTARGWTEWTQGFQYGSAVLQFDATGDTHFLDIGRQNTVDRMAPHLSNTGVHDHGFNNVSTYGNLLRLMHEGVLPPDDWERRFYELALKVSGAVQAARWTRIAGGGGFIHSFNGPHSLFVDTIRSLRALALSHRLGHMLMAEGDRPVSLLARLIDHLNATARYSVYYGEGRDAYDIRGRTAHESIFNINDGNYRCPGSQQGYSPFSTWTRGLAWAILGFAEQLEFLDEYRKFDPTPFEDWNVLETTCRRAAEATASFYIANSAADGIPYWDTGAPGLDKLGDWRAKPADPFNPHEPVDSSAAPIAAQGLLRLGEWLDTRGAAADALIYREAGLNIASSLFDEPYLSADPNHQGLLLHAVYHRPNGWDAIPPGASVPRGEACMWGDYHLRELALYLLRIAEKKTYLTFWNVV